MNNKILSILNLNDYERKLILQVQLILIKQGCEMEIVLTPEKKKLFGGICDL